MSRYGAWACGFAATAVVLAGSALAQESTSYGYDGLGRLRSTSIAGGPNNSRNIGICFDAGGNRTRYDTSTSTPSACAAPSPIPSPTPTPTSTPTPSWTIVAPNLPPVANIDSTSFHCSLSKTVNVAANDTDPEGNLPLNVQSIVSDEPGNAWAFVSSASSVQLAANAPGSYSFSYVISDSLGNTSFGVITITVTGTDGTCQDGPPLL